MLRLKLLEKQHTVGVKFMYELASERQETRKKYINWRCVKMAKE